MRIVATFHRIVLFLLSVGYAVSPSTNMAGPILLYPAFRHFRGFPRLWKYHWNPTTLSRRKFRLSIYPVGKDRARNNDSNLLMSSRAVFAASSTRKCLRCWPVGYKGLTIYLRVRGFMRRTARKTSRRRYFYLTFVPLCILALKEKWRKWGESSVLYRWTTPPTFHESCACAVIKEGGEAREEGAFSRVPGTKDGLYTIWKRRSPRYSEGRGRCVFLRVLGN